MRKRKMSTSARTFLATVFCAFLLFSLVIVMVVAAKGAAVAASSPKSLSYHLVSKQKVPFGAPIERPYVLDSFDVNGDGADDFAISAQTKVTNTRDYTKNKFVHSLFVLNDLANNTFTTFDLGEPGLTQRTWAGKFFRTAGNPSVFLVLGRNGEIGLPHTLIGEKTSIFQINSDAAGVSIQTAFVGKALGTTASVDVCDINHDGKREIYVNNVNSPFIQNSEFLTPHMIIFDGTSFTDPYNPRLWVKGIDNGGAHNSIVFDDVDGDGNCDLMAAFEVWKVGGANVAYQNINENDRTKSYMVP